MLGLARKMSKANAGWWRRKKVVDILGCRAGGHWRHTTKSLCFPFSCSSIEFFLFSQKTQQHFSRPLFLLHGNATYRAFKHRFAKVNWPITCSRTKKGFLIVLHLFYYYYGIITCYFQMLLGHCWKDNLFYSFIDIFMCWFGWPDGHHTADDWLVFNVFVGCSQQKT